MHRRAVGEHNGWTKRGARTWIAPRHDGSHVIAARIEAGNGLSIAGEHLRVGVRRKSRADRNVGRQDRKRIERRRTYGADARIGLVGGIAVKTIELGFTLVEIDINAGLGKTIVTRDRAVQLHRIYTGLAGKLFERLRAVEISTRRRIFPDWRWPG